MATTLSETIAVKVSKDLYDQVLGKAGTGKGELTNYVRRLLEVAVNDSPDRATNHPGHEELLQTFVDQVEESISEMLGNALAGIEEKLRVTQELVQEQTKELMRMQIATKQLALNLLNMHNHNLPENEQQSESDLRKNVVELFEAKESKG